MFHRVEVISGAACGIAVANTSDYHTSAKTGEDHLNDVISETGFIYLAMY